MAAGAPEDVTADTGLVVDADFCITVLSVSMGCKAATAAADATAPASKWSLRRKPSDNGCVMKRNTDVNGLTARGVSTVTAVAK